MVVENLNATALGVPISTVERMLLHPSAALAAVSGG